MSLRKIKRRTLHRIINASVFFCGHKTRIVTLN